MKLKRIVVLTLVTALLCSLMTFPAHAVQTSAFSDITDPEMAQAAEILRLLDIVNGTGSGRFEPSRVLSRAEFCKMAVELMGAGDQVASQMNRTVFKDVPATHWARGYINVATKVSMSAGEKDVTASPGIIRGDPYGNFSPDRPITYAEAITILVRILKYTDSDVGLIWPDGYLATAKSLGITDGITLPNNASLTRGQSVLLLENLLYAKVKGADGKEFLTTLGVTIGEEVLVLAVDAEALDGSLTAVKTAGDKTYQTKRVPFAQSVVGRKGKLVLNKDGDLLDIQLSDKGSQKTINLIPGEYNYLKSGDGTSIKVTPKTKVWQDGEETTYEKVWQKLRSGTQALLQYSTAGELEYVFLQNSVTQGVPTAMVAKNTPSGNPFGGLAGSQTGYAIYKNGVPATDKDIRQYDVATFDKGANVLYVSDLRLTGVFENAYPNPQAPATMRVMGHDFTVLDSALSDIASVKLGSVVTLLLTYDGQVAGVVSTDVAQSTTVGIVSSIDDAGNATVLPLADLRDAAGNVISLSGATSYTSTSATQMKGQLVNVTSSQKGRLNLSKLSGSASSSPLSLATGKIGTTELAKNVRLYERVGTSTPEEIKLSDITSATVASGKILYVRKDYADKADIVVFDNVTGDRYTYGAVKYIAATNTPDAHGGIGSFTNATIAVENAAKGHAAIECGIQAGDGNYGGMVASIDGGKLASYIDLSAIKGVAVAAFNTADKVVSTPSAIYPIAANVQCYNKSTKSWFTLSDSLDNMAALDQALAFSGTLTLYVDKAPQDGGKVRIVVVE